MKAAAFREYGGPEVLAWQALPDPVPAPDEVVVAVRACGVNHSDLDSRAGTSRWEFAFPHVLGAEFAGVVTEVGREVTSIRIGDPVTALQQYACGRCPSCEQWRADLCERFTVYGTDCWGGYAELVRVPARAVLALSSSDDFVLAAAAQCTVSTAWHMVTRLSGIRPGETVLIPSASGGVASAAVQCAKLAGARVIATVGSPEKIDRVSALGADEVFCYRDDPVVATVEELTGGRGVDAVLDTVGGSGFTDLMRSMCPEGRLVICGAHAGEIVDLDLIELFRRGHQVRGFRVASPPEIRTALDMVFQGRIQVPVARTFPLREASASHHHLNSRTHVGKVVLVHGDN